jgi:secondary thiamine-phosphate synthase enzyme
MASTGPVKDIAAPQPPSRIHQVHVESRTRVEFKDITSLVQKIVTESGIQSGTCFLFLPHTTAAILINENEDPALQKDLANFLKTLAPLDSSYHHNDGNCDAHLKAALIGNSKSLLVDRGRLILGRWQGIFLCDFDGPRRRELMIKVVPD